MKISRLIKILPHFLIATLLFAGVSAYSQHIATASFDTNEVLIGSHIRLTYSIETDQANQIFFPEINDSLNEHLTMISLSKIDTVINKKQQRKTLSQTYTFTIFDPGRYNFPEIPFVVMLPNDELGHPVGTNSLELFVHAPELDSTDSYKDIKPIMKVSRTEVWGEFLREHYVWAIIIAILLAVIIFAAVYFYKKRKKQPLFSAPKPALPPYLIALNQLEALSREELWQQNRIKDYYTKLTDILRLYFRNEFQVDAMEMTSDEIIAELPSLEIQNKRTHVENMTYLLRLADRVKFAKYLPSSQEHELCFQDVMQFIKDNMVKEIKKEEANV